jgi:hypothetical protein
MIKKLIKTTVLVGFFLFLPIINEMVEESYWVSYASTSVEPAQIKDDTVATTFQLEYKEEQYTVTNLHVCRIPHKMKQHRRNNYNHKRIGQDKMPISFPPLKDIDLVGQYIKVGDFDRQIIAVSEFHDLCLLEPNPNIKAFKLASSYENGELVRVIGFPRGLSKTIRKGRIFNKDEAYFPWLKRTTEFVHISSIGYPGNSGSPVINKWGNVVGVLFAGNFFHTETMIVPLEYLRNFMERSG